MARAGLWVRTRREISRVDVRERAATMSFTSRQVLHGCGDKSFVTQGEIDHHDCFTKNLSAVEEHFTHTHLFERVNPNKLAPRTHLEYHWLTPGDCVRKDAEISSGLDFNRANRTSCTRD